MSIAAVPGLYLLPVDVEIADVYDVFPGRVDVLDGITDKASLIEAVAGVLEFPGYGRPNWDSYEELLLDLTWLDSGPRVLVLTGSTAFAEHDPDAWEVALSIWARATQLHARGSAPLHVFLLG